MTDRCTCGATPPDDARFCHKCGRPLYEEPELEATPTVETVVAAPAPPPEKPKINFHNSVAVRVALMAGGLTCLLISLPLPVYIAAIWAIVTLLAGGFFSVFMYQRRTGLSLSVGSGARMGWITGIFCSVIMLVTIAFRALTASAEFAEAFRQSVDANGSGHADEVRKMLEEPSGFALMFVLGLLGLFLLLTAVTVAGGALGAKVLEKE